MKQIKGNKGFGLVECVVAMFLICIALLGMASHIGVSMAAMQTDKIDIRGQLSSPGQGGGDSSRHPTTVSPRAGIRS